MACRVRKATKARYTIPDGTNEKQHANIVRSKSTDAFL